MKKPVKAQTKQASPPVEKVAPKKPVENNKWIAALKEIRDKWNGNTTLDFRKRLQLINRVLPKNE